MSCVATNCSSYIYRNTSTHKPAANHSPWNELVHVRAINSSPSSEVHFLITIQLARQLSTDLDYLPNSIETNTVQELRAGKFGHVSQWWTMSNYKRKYLQWISWTLSYWFPWHSAYQAEHYIGRSLGGLFERSWLWSLAWRGEKGRLLWPWASVMRFLNNNEALLTWLVIRNVLSASGNFTRVHPVWWYGGVDRARLLWLPGRTAVVETSWRLHSSHIESEVLFFFFFLERVL